MTATVVLTQLLREKLAVSMTMDQARHLWAECRMVLLDDLQIATIVAVENDANLETFVPHGTQRDLLFAVGMIFAGLPWPREDTSVSDTQSFLDRVAEAVTQRCYGVDG